MGMIARLFDRVIGPRVLLADPILYARPEEFGLAAREVEVPGARGVMLRGLWVDGPPEAPAVLFLPGNSANLSGHLSYLGVLARAGLRALGLDYAGFGQSGGRPSLRGLLGDAEAGLNALERLSGPGAAVGVFGVSLGAGLGMALAARRGEIGAVAAEGLSIQREAVRGLLADGALGPRWVRVVREDDGAPAPRTSHRLMRPPRWGRGALGSGALSLLAGAAYPFAGKDPRSAAGRLGRRPVFIIHGAQDPLLPLEGALLVHGALAGPRRLWLIPEAGHAQEPAILCDEEYALQLGGFFREAFSAAPLPAPEIEWRSERREERRRVEIDLRGPAGPYLVSLIAGGELRFLRLWVDAPRGAAAGSARREIDLPAEPREAHALRAHRAERRGDGWTPIESESARGFRRLEGKLRGLSAALIQGRLTDADRTLAEIEREALPPPLDLLRRLHRARRARLAPLGAALALSASLLGCAARSPFPDLGPLSPEEAERVIEERHRAVRSLTAVVRVAVDSRELSGSFDVIAHFERPEKLRLSAFKDLLLGTRPIFDLALRGEEYAVLLHGEDKSELRRGMVADLPRDLPEMAPLAWLREALFLPGGRRPGLRFFPEPRTLEIRRAELVPPGRTRPITVRYRDWRAAQGALVPGRVAVEDPEGGFAMQGILRDLEVNPELDAASFEVELPGAAAEAPR